MAWRINPGKLPQICPERRYHRTKRTKKYQQAYDIK